jgi:predicted dienelactone hydrolase
MYPLEIIFIALVLGFLVGQTVRGVPRNYLLTLLAAGLAVVVLAGVLGQIRWQMLPAYLLFAILSLLTLKRSYSHVAVRLVGVSLGAVLLLVAATLSVGLPVLSLPAPDGPNTVGTASFHLVDDSRDNSFFGAPDEERELYLQAWYPGVIEEGQREPRVRTLWAELYRGERDLFTAFASYLRGVKTHSYDEIPLSAAQASYPVIVFSHAMGSFAEQSTPLMEHLASHGYVVLSVGHTYTSMRVVSSDGRAIYLNLELINEVSAPYDAEAADIAAKLEQAGSAEERMNLQLDRYERATGLNALMATWVDDLRFVLDSITTPSDRDLKLQAISRRIDADRIGLLGMSFGGGAVTELCKSDARCRAALNIDGGTFGQRQRQPLQVPYLSLTRENQDSVAYLLPASRSDYYAVEVAGATHLDFTDDTIVLPILKWLGITGAISAERVIEITNVVSLRFFDAYLRGGPKPRFGEAFPELTVEMNDYAVQ